jgi:Domain of unknown function (DU1801)
MPTKTRFSDPKVEKVFSTYPTEIRAELLTLRELIFTTAKKTSEVGKITETLKWGEPAYLTEKSKSGSTIRVGWKKTAPTRFSVYFNCQTTLVETFRTVFPTEFQFEGNREIAFVLGHDIDYGALALCLEMALTYHRSKPISNSQLKYRKEL